MSLCTQLDKLPEAEQWVGLRTVIKVKSYRHLFKNGYLMIRRSRTRYYISSLNETVADFAQRIRDYWQVENKVHYVRDVTQGEDASRIRVHPLPNIFTVARNFSLNLFRDHGVDNMAQAQRRSGFGLNFLKTLFRMK